MTEISKSATASPADADAKFDSTPTSPRSTIDPVIKIGCIHDISTFQDIFSAVCDDGGNDDDGDDYDDNDDYNEQGKNEIDSTAVVSAPVSIIKRSNDDIINEGDFTAGNNNVMNTDATAETTAKREPLSSSSVTELSSLTAVSPQPSKKESSKNNRKHQVTSSYHQLRCQLKTKTKQPPPQPFLTIQKQPLPTTKRSSFKRSSLSSQRSRSSRSIKINELVSVEWIPTRSCIAQHVSNKQLWFQEDEYEEIRYKTKELIQTVQQNDTDEKMYCTRGLEKYFHLEEVRKIQYEAWDSVLDEQDFQWDCGFSDSNLISQVYQKFTRRSIEEAVERAQQDAAAIE